MSFLRSVSFVRSHRSAEARDERPLPTLRGVPTVCLQPLMRPNSSCLQPGAAGSRGRAEPWGEGAKAAALPALGEAAGCGSLVLYFCIVS